MAFLLSYDFREHISTILAILVFAVEALGVAHAAHAVLTARSPQGSVAWALSLVFLPWLAIPAYWIFGRNKFDQYAEAIRDAQGEYMPLFERARAELRSSLADDVGLERQTRELFESIAPHPFTGGNAVKLLLDGKETFNSIFEAVAAAKSSVLVEYYIFKHDALGREFLDLLERKAEEGLEVHLIYDEFASGLIPRRIMSRMRKGGAKVSEFGAPRRSFRTLRVNFRNHRKIVVVDGKILFVGGLNVGNEYLSRGEHRRYWRDTHLRVEGPAALAAQSAFLADLAWAADYPPPELDWTPEPKGDAPVLILPSGPADKLQVCSLFFMEAICSAKRRLWLATPYFVPDAPIVKALLLAASRGVEVKILIPRKSDNPLVYLAGLTFLEDLEHPNIEVLLYGKGFMHHKVMLVDDTLASVGTANFDNRSFYLNFEIGAIVAERAFAAEVEEMFLMDMTHCRPLKVDDYLRKNPGYRVLCQAARLLSPVL